MSGRAGRSGTPRAVYLQALVSEFQTATDTGPPPPLPSPHPPVPLTPPSAPLATAAARLQVLSHLANFAYDPGNYAHLRNLRVLELFLGPPPRASHRAREGGSGLRHRPIAGRGGAQTAWTTALRTRALSSLPWRAYATSALVPATQTH
jgi:hypothetical protein